MKRLAILAAFAPAFVLVLIVAVGGGAAEAALSPRIAQSMQGREHLLRKAAAPVLTWRHAKARERAEGSWQRQFARTHSLQRL